MAPYEAPVAEEPRNAARAARRRVGLGGVLAGVFVRPVRFFAALSDSDVRVWDVAFYAVLSGVVDTVNTGSGCHAACRRKRTCTPSRSGWH